MRTEHTPTRRKAGSGTEKVRKEKSEVWGGGVIRKYQSFSQGTLAFGNNHNCLSVSSAVENE